jgi:hypothetical protein
MRDYEREIDEDARREAIDERRRRRRCECGLDGYPGRCPGAESCPYAGRHSEEDEGGDDE